MVQLTGEYPRPISRPAWLSSRARNAAKRPVFIGAVGVAAFIVALVALLLAPQQIRRGVIRQRPRVTDAPQDTVPLIAALAQARGRVTAAESSLATARTNVHAPVAVNAPSPLDIVHRDTLSSAVNELDALLTRVENAPVPASYRALGESPQLSSNPRVKAMLDSLDDIEKERDGFGGTGAADPMYLALTARATEIGRVVQAIAQEKRDALRQEFAKVSAPALRVAVAQSPISDTTAWISARDSAQSLVAQATTALDASRDKWRSHDIEVGRANSQAEVDVPPIALLGAALVFGVALGFGSAFVREMRSPRISGDHEVERVTGARVLATVSPRSRAPDRRRRLADHDVPPYFDPAADGYQLTFLHVARAGASRLVLTVAAEETGIAAVVAANVAAIAADEARSTILIDTDSLTSPVAAVLRIHAEPGMSDILERRVDWAEVSTQAQVGRDRAIDVIPSGLSQAARAPAMVVAFFRREAARIARHYEAIIVATSLEEAKAGLPSALTIPDTIVCARIGHTRIADLQEALAAIRAAGGNPLGVVLWNAVAPALPTAEGLSRSRRPLRTAEMEALTS